MSKPGLLPIANALLQGYNLYQQGRDMYRSFQKPRVNTVNPLTTVMYPRLRLRQGSSRSRTGVKTRTRKRTYSGKRKRNSLKRTVWRMKKKMRCVITPQKDLVMDQVPDRWTSVQGQSPWFSSQLLDTKNVIATGPIYNTTGFCLSPHSVPWLMQSIRYLVSPLNDFYPGRSKFCLHSWELTTRITNISNCPSEVECYTIKAKKLVPVNQDTDTGLAPAQGFNDFIHAQMLAQYGMNTGFANSVYHPAFKLTDCNKFLEYFKIIRHKRRVIQPGEALRIRKFGSKSRIFDSQTMYNAHSSDYTAHLPKGALCYIYRATGVPNSQESKTATDVTLCDTHFDVVHTYHIRTSVLPYSRYDAPANPGALTSGQTLKVIFPGSSEAKTAAPAT